MLRLSDAYEVEEKEHSLELTATLININPGYNQALKDACQALADYSEYTARVRENTKTLPIAEAVEEAIDSCIREGILADFLKQNRAEAISMSIFEYDEEKHMQMEREENLERGRAEGLAEGRAEGITNNLLQNIKSLMKTMDLSQEQAMDALEVSEQDREMVRPLL